MAFVDRGLLKVVLNVHLKGGHSFIVDGVVLFMWDEQFKVEESCHIYCGNVHFYVWLN
jgi:hypothetical protein